MMRLHEVVGDMLELAFISNHCTSIRRVIYKVFPTALHNLCFYHLEGNIKSHFKNLGKLWKYFFRLVFLQVVKMYDIVEFEKQMEGLWSMHASAAKYLEDISFNYWVKFDFEGRKYSILTTNIAESMNALMKKLRKFPITQLVEHFRLTMQQWFYDRKKATESMTTILLVKCMFSMSLIINFRLRKVV